MRDWNRNGKMDAVDHFIIHEMIMNGVGADKSFGSVASGRRNKREADHDHFSDGRDDYEWREDYDGEYDVDPEDYETEEEYMEALDEEKYGWRDTAEDGEEYGLDPEDYETEEEYMDALDDAGFDW